MPAEVQFKNLGYQQISAPAAATALTVPAGSDYAIIQALTQNIRWRDDGVDPTASVGMQLTAGLDFLYSGDLSALRVIQEAGSAEVNVSYYASPDYVG